MKIHKIFIAIGMIVAFSLFFELAAHADEGYQTTEITFNQPIQVPGQVLPAGTYLFKLADDENLDLVQIFSQDRMHLYATLQTIPTESGQVLDDTTVTLAKQEAGPVILLKWFYPGSNTGHEFIYSNRLQEQISQDQQQMVVANQQSTAGSGAVGSN